MICEMETFINTDYIIPPSTLGDVLYITNFLKYFKDNIEIADFEVEELYSELVYEGPKQLKLVYLIKVALIKMVVEEYRYRDS